MRLLEDSENKTAYTLDKDSILTFDKDKGLPLEIDWDTNQILCTRFDEERPLEPQVYYTASGLDDNGDVISKTLQMIPKDDTQDTGKFILRYTIRTANITKKVRSMLTNPLVTVAIGITSRGKYIFFTISFSRKIEVEPSCILDAKNIHGTRATKRNR